ncbi:putative Calpain catalytic domain-containing protein [Seiridium unicorne]|uniref:Calpain catalytic domain-containing protein n=1 Tax=Seiridium unicorne TaxID=138068 RepID=A0ABR2UHJ2_9PEZI
MARLRSRKEVPAYSSSESEEEQPRRSTRSARSKRYSKYSESDSDSEEEPRRSARSHRSRRDLEAFGYSSSSESEDDRSRKSKLNNNQPQKKKKKRKPSPQRSINKIWRHFAAKKFTKALAILPFDPVPLPSNQDRPNELLNAGYERAAEECRRKVKKIIQECKRVNTRYRDPGWDIDWDLKMVKGNTLNYLGSHKFDIYGPRLSSSTAIPKSVKRVHEIYQNPTFMENLDAGDVKQGNLGDCWLIASLSALANVEDGVKRMCVEYDTRIGIYGFVFFRDGEWVYSIVDDKLFLTSPNWDSPSMQRDLLTQIDRESEDAEQTYRKTYQTGSKSLFFGSNKDPNETWVALIEKAFAKVHGDFSSLIGGWIGEGLEDLSGGVTTELLGSDILDLDGFWENEVSKVNQEFMFGCSTGLLDGGYGERNGIREGHAYVVMDAKQLKNGERLVKLRNPWGKLKKGIWDGPWSDGSKEWTTAAQEELNHTFGNDSVFWIRYEDLLRKFQHFDRTRLFRDADWRCCQRWIGVEVPWKPQYNEKFHFTLTKESPLVLVLSQLDNRYYKGLHGQYTFRLHFRIHEQGKPGAEDYIVRSHGNYLMDRSVSIELPCMEPGNYSVFVSVVGERDTDFSTIEDVVKRECKKRQDHDKLASVGYAYDLAHAKGVAHLEQVAKLRKQSDAKKASTSRQAERRKLWEKRHLNRETTKKQQKKNQAKRDRNREVREAERKKKEDAEAAERKVKEEAEEAARKKKEEAEAAERKAREEAEEVERKKKEAEKPKDNISQTDKADSPEKSEESAAKSETDKNNDLKEGTAEKAEDKKAEEKAVESEAKSSSPPPPTAESKRTDYSSDNDSSDSPVEDWEDLYSSDDMSRKPRMAPPPPPPANNDKTVETDEEAGLPDPWNAICIVGFRVYSKDENLDLRVVIEGGELAEGGMGEKGAQDIDNAQMNGAGEREKTLDTEKVKDEVEIVHGEAIVKPKIHPNDEKKKNRPIETPEIKVEEVKADEQNDVQDDDNHSVSSMDSTPLPTPGEEFDDPSDNCTPQRAS